MATRLYDRPPMDQLTAHLDRGWDLVSRGDLAGALLSAKKGIELAEDSPEAHHLLGYVRAAEGESEEALEHYHHAIELDDTFFEAMVNAAELMLHPLGDFDGAIAMIDDALELTQSDDEVADATLIKIEALMHLGRTEEATRLISLLPEGPFENAQVDYLIGRAKFEAGDREGAEGHIRAAIEKEPSQPEPHYYLAEILETQGDRRGATVHMLQARELDAALPPVPWHVSRDQFEARVRGALGRLAPGLQALVDGTLVVVCDVPGAEVVADGVDARVPLLIDVAAAEPSAADAASADTASADTASADAASADTASADTAPPKVARMFVYQNNVERSVASVADVERALEDELTRELSVAFPAEAKAAGVPEDLLEELASEIAQAKTRTTKKP